MLDGKMAGCSCVTESKQDLLEQYRPTDNLSSQHLQECVKRTCVSLEKSLSKGMKTLT